MEVINNQSRVTDFSTYPERDIFSNETITRHHKNPSPRPGPVKVRECTCYCYYQTCCECGKMVNYIYYVCFDSCKCCYKIWREKCGVCKCGWHECEKPCEPRHNRCCEYNPCHQSSYHHHNYYCCSPFETLEKIRKCFCRCLGNCGF